MDPAITQSASEKPRKNAVGICKTESINSIIEKRTVSGKRDRQFHHPRPVIFTTAQEAYSILLQLSTKVGHRLEKADQSANNLCVEIKYATFDKYTRQMPLSSPTQDGKKLYRAACHLFDTLWNGNPIRLLGVRAGKLTDADEPVQLDLFSYDPKAIEKEQKMERAMDKIREKFGKDLIQKGIH